MDDSGDEDDVDDVNYRKHGIVDRKLALNSGKPGAKLCIWHILASQL